MSSLLTVRLVRHLPGIWVLLLTMWFAILFICATPLLGSYAMLVAAMSPVRPPSVSASR